MVKISENPSAFLDHLKTNVGVTFIDENWAAPGLLANFFNFGKASSTQISKYLIKAIDQFELTGKWEKETTQAYVHCAKHVCNMLKTDKDEESRQELKLRINALKEHISPRKDFKGDVDQLFESINARSVVWASKQWNIENTSLTNSQKDQLDKLKNHPRLMKRLAESQQIFDRFATWSLRYACGENKSVEIFQRFPGLTQTLMQGELHPTLSYHGGLKCKGNKVTVPALLEENGKIKPGRINLLKSDEKYVFANKFEVTVEKLLEIFKKYNHRWDIREIPFEYAGDGFENFNPYQHGSWDPEKKEWKRIDLSSPDFYTESPQVHKKFDKQDLESVYEITIKDSEWVHILEAARDTNLLDPGNAHAWVKIFQPIGNDQYKLLGSFSRSAKDNYNTALKRSQLFMNTVPGGLCMNEPRVYESEQQFRGVAFAISEEKGKKALEILRNMAVDSHKNELHYQVVGNNCFKPMVDFTKDIVGKEAFEAKCPDEDLKISPFKFYVPLAFAQKIHTRLMSCSRSIQEKCLWIFATLYGQHRSMLVKGERISVSTHAEFGRGELKIYAPQEFIGKKPNPRFL